MQLGGEGLYGAVGMLIGFSKPKYIGITDMWVIIFNQKTRDCQLLSGASDLALLLSEKACSLLCPKANEAQPVQQGGPMVV